MKKNIQPELLLITPIIYTTFFYLFFRLLGIGTNINWTTIGFLLLTGLPSYIFGIVGITGTFVKAKSYKRGKNVYPLQSKLIDEYYNLTIATIILFVINFLFIPYIGFMWLSPLVLPQLFMLISLILYSKSKDLEKLSNTKTILNKTTF